MKWLVTLALLGLGAAVGLTAGPVKSRAHGSNTVSRTKTSSTAVKASSRRGRYSKGRRRAPVPSYQTHPDPGRYQEIQKALADRGYLKTEPNGQWDADSMDALKRFQADQRIDPDGTINARTLFGLGLGPKHDGSAVASASTPSAPPPPAAPEFFSPQ